MLRLAGLTAALVALNALVAPVASPPQAAGIITSPDKKAVLMVRRGATNVRLRIVAPGSERGTNALLVRGSFYEIVPPELTLHKAAHFRISYNEQALPDGIAESDLTLLHYADGAWREVPNATLNTAKNQVAANVRQLGGYAVGVLATP